MRLQEFLRDPAIKEKTDQASRMLARNREMAAYTRDERANISNLEADAAIVRLSCLLDQRIVILDELTGTFERVLQIFLTAGQVSDDPVEELKRLMDTIGTNQTMLESLLDESEKIQIRRRKR